MQTSAVDGNVTQETFVAYIEEYIDVDQAVAQAVGMRKDLRKRIKGAGFSLAAFDRARAEADKSQEKREAEDREYRRNMAWLGLPLGAQGNLFEEPEGEDTATTGNGEDTEENSQQTYQVELAGRAAGERGAHRGDNPWGPGSELNRVWDKGWMAGQEILANRGGTGEVTALRRGPGRPRGTHSRPTGGDAA